MISLNQGYPYISVINRFSFCHIIRAHIFESFRRYGTAAKLVLNPGNQLWG